jgi:RHH-type proline utilization regulon transcriptional repressor/proline dehydrogenase/delta 1-pyrroline-5-carboxylate dehydrogenase
MLARTELPGPTGEANVLELRPRGVVACIADEDKVIVAQARAAHALGNAVLLPRTPASLRARDALTDIGVTMVDRFDPGEVDAVMLEASPARIRQVRAELAAAEGRLVPVVVPDARGSYDWRRLVLERTVTVNTAAAGGNTGLLSLEDAEEQAL